MFFCFDVKSKISRAVADVEEPYHFLSFFGLEADDDHFNPINVSIISTYFALTTLTTIGFGDLHPVTQWERLLMIFLFLFGVTLFSYFMSVFFEIINSYS